MCEGVSNCPSTGLPIEQAPCKIIFDFDIPEKINNIIDFPKRYRENTGFNISPDEMKRVNTPQVIKIEEEKGWREIEQMLLLEEKGRQGLTGWQIAAGQ